MFEDRLLEQLVGKQSDKSLVKGCRVCKNGGRTSVGMSADLKQQHRFRELAMANNGQWARPELHLLAAACPRI
jgi:hypothetical protein